MLIEGDELTQWDTITIRRKCKEGTERERRAYLAAGYILKPELMTTDSIDVLFRDNPKVSLAELAKVICCKHDITYAELVGNSRVMNLVDARREFTIIAYKIMGRSTTAIGRFLGGRDHSTILEYLKYGSVKRRPRTDETHCRNGHEYTPENTKVHNGFRRCRQCYNSWYREHRRQLRLKGKPECQPIL